MSLAQVADHGRQVGVDLVRQLTLQLNHFVLRDRLELLEVARPHPDAPRGPARSIQIRIESLLQPRDFRLVSFDDRPLQSQQRVECSAGIAGSVVGSDDRVGRTDDAANRLTASGRNQPESDPRIARIPFGER